MALHRIKLIWRNISGRLWFPLLLCNKAQIIKIEYIPIKVYSCIAIILTASIQNANIKKPLFLSYAAKGKLISSGSLPFMML